MLTTGPRGQFPRWRRSRKTRTGGNAQETWTIAAADGVGCARER
jgi:hypothetical protein